MPLCLALENYKDITNNECNYYLSAIIHLFSVIQHQK